jgi:protoporphyrinogen oxidase
MLLLQDNILIAAKRSLQVSDVICIASYMDNNAKTEYPADSYVLVKDRTGAPPTRMHTV